MKSKRCAQSRQRISRRPTHRRPSNANTLPTRYRHPIRGEPCAQHMRLGQAHCPISPTLPQDCQRCAAARYSSPTLQAAAATRTCLALGRLAFERGRTAGSGTGTSRHPAAESHGRAAERAAGKTAQQAVPPSAVHQGADRGAACSVGIDVSREGRRTYRTGHQPWVCLAPHVRGASLSEAVLDCPQRLAAWRAPSVLPH
mmetsp:Transcript_18174/g.30378  ORF Transcript_18174/g.30378 Transcript_18174/m.30378 type:complete len:200 (+) Transcript_18174:265-864(+)